MEDVQRIHAAQCKKSDPTRLQLSVDGVQESKSSTVTTDVYSVSFPDCQKVYPIRLIRPTNRFKYDEQEQILQVLTDLKHCKCRILDVILDNPKRASIRCALMHNSTYACEYCESKAVLVQDALISLEQKKIKKKFNLRKKNLNNTIEFLKESPGSTQGKKKDEEKIKELTVILENLKEEEERELKSVGKRGQLAWPFSTMNGTLRTTDLIKYTVNKIASTNGTLDKHEKKGFKGTSHFLDLPNFHFINNIPAEYLHLTCLGVVKRMLELTFQTGENRVKTSTRKLSDTSQFNKLMKTVKFLREFSRRCRNLDLSVIKGQEYRNIILFFWPFVIECIDDEYPKEKIIWLNLVYAIRACVLPEIEFNLIDSGKIKNACKKFYSLYEKSFGEKNCTYSIHVLPSHLLRIRGDKPLTARSAFIYENFYSEMKNLFEPGTNSPLKQILQNTMLKRTLETHYCTKPITYCPVKVPNTGLENNSMIYTLNENNQHVFYNIIEMNGDTFHCAEQGKFVHDCPLTPEIDWSSVGVYKIGPSSMKTKEIVKDQINGKVIKVGTFLITCPINVLNEQ